MCPRSAHVRSVLLWLHLLAVPAWANSEPVLPTKTDMAAVVPPSTGGHEASTVRVGVDASGVAELTKASSSRLMRRVGLPPGISTSDDKDTKKVSVPVDASAHFVGASFIPASSPSLRSDPAATIPLAAFVELGAKEANSKLTHEGPKRHHHNPTKKGKRKAKHADVEDRNDEGIGALSHDSSISKNDMQQEGAADINDDAGADDSAGGDTPSEDSSLSQEDVQQKGDADTSDDPEAGDGLGGDTPSEDSSLSQEDVQAKGDADTSDDPEAGDGLGGDTPSEDSSLSQEDVQAKGDADTSDDPEAGDGSGGDTSSEDSALSQEDMQQKSDVDTNDESGAGDGSGGDASSEDSSLSQEDVEQKDDAESSEELGKGEGSGGDAPSDDSAFAQVTRKDIMPIPESSANSGGDSASDDSSLSQEYAQGKDETATSDDLGGSEGSGGDSASDDSSLSQDQAQDQDPGDTDKSGGDSASDDSELPTPIDDLGGGQSSGGDSAVDDSSLSQKEAQDEDHGDSANSGDEESSDESSLLQQKSTDKDDAQTGDDPSGGDSSGVLVEKYPYDRNEQPARISRSFGAAGEFNDKDARVEHYPDEEPATHARGEPSEHSPDEEATRQNTAFSDGATAYGASMHTDASHPHAFSDLRHASHIRSGTSEIDAAKTEAASAHRAMEYQVEKVVDRTIAEALRKATKERRVPDA